MKLPILDIQSVAEGQLCCGCGVCAAAEPGRFEMVDDYKLGRRPVVREGAPAETGEAMAVCPGASLEHTYDRGDPGLVRELMAGWGPVRAVWEGYASDDAIRLAGSSGGAASALGLYAIERGGMRGVLHIAARENDPVRNETVISTNREQLLARTGSRYAPASPCDGLGMIESADGPCAFIGKPCDAAGAMRLRERRPELDRKLGIVVAFFCAGAPSYEGNVELLKKAGCGDPSKLRGLRYRGRGWPGMWRAEFDSERGEESREMTYAESWGFLQKYRAWRCYICPDHTGEFADIAVGDPWYRPVEPGEAGKSLIVARTERGLAFVRAAAEAGYLTLETEDAGLLARSQPNLLATRGSLAARRLVLRAAGAPVPRYKGFAFWRFWWSELGLKAKLQSLWGTAKRVRSKRLRHRRPVEPWAGTGGSA